MLDESLFNPHFAGADLLSYGFVPALGIGVPWTLYVFTLHVIWSIGAPIAVTEGLFPRPTGRYEPVPPQQQASWLGRLGLVVGLVGTTAFQLVRRLPGHVSPWLLSVLLVAVLAAAAVVSRLVHADAVGLGTGAVLTYGWVGLSTAVAAGRAAVVEQAVLVVLALAVLVLAARRFRGGAALRSAE